MSTHENQKIQLQINDSHKELLGTTKVIELQNLVSEMSLPENEAGIISLDIQLGESSVFLFTFLFNTSKEQVKDQHIEFRIYDKEQDLAAAGYMADAQLPLLMPGEVHFWVFNVPFAAFVKSGADLREWSLDVKAKEAPFEEGKDIETIRQYSFYHIIKPSVGESVTDVKVIPTKIKYDATLDVNDNEEKIYLSDEEKKESENE